MKINNFIRFSESIKTREDKRVVSVTIRPLISDCTGEIYFTDLQLQEGNKLTGYTPNTTTMLKSSKNPAKYFNAIVRSGDTLVLHTSGGTSTGLDCYIYPNQAMVPGSIKLSQGAGSHGATFLSSANAGDEFALLASKRECLRNGNTTAKNGFYQYIAVYDDKHQVQLEKGKSARVYFEFKEMTEGDHSL
ncbi:MAG: hypothetical protein WBP82_02215 [Leuconostoc mesenteroides]